jgi:hypothetical protein
MNLNRLGERAILTKYSTVNTPTTKISEYLRNSVVELSKSGRVSIEKHTTEYKINPVMHHVNTGLSNTLSFFILNVHS